MKIQGVDHDTGDHDSWCVYDMLLPAAVEQLLGEAGGLTPYHSWYTLHLKSRDKQDEGVVLKQHTWTRMCSLLGWFMSPNCCHLT